MFSKILGHSHEKWTAGPLGQAISDGKILTTYEAKDRYEEDCGKDPHLDDSRYSFPLIKVSRVKAFLYPVSNLR